MQRSHQPPRTRPVVVLVGPSAAGKTTVARALRAAGVVRVHPTWTTRPRRTDEPWLDLGHRFVTDDGFDWLERAGFFAATAHLPGLDHRYGLPRIVPSDGRAVDVVIARAAQVPLIAELVPSTVVLQLDVDDDTLARRLAHRGLSDFEVAARLRAARAERDDGRRIADCLFVNFGDLDAVLHAISAVLVALRSGDRQVAS
jgi:ribose 1,5-bisphosphokinase PhnN